VAVNNILAEPSHNDVVEAAMLTDGVTGSSSIVIVLLETCEIVVHCALDVKVTETTSPDLSVLLVKVVLFVPTFTPFTFHWKIGLLPSFIAVAVNVIDSPLQTEVVVDVMKTSGSNSGLTTTVTGFMSKHPPLDSALM
jgi:hypothetical protein